MRTLARTATSSLVSLCVALALVAAAVAAIGIAGTRSAASQGNAIADDELTTAVVTGQATSANAAPEASADLIPSAGPVRPPAPSVRPPGLIRERFRPAETPRPD